MQRTTREADRSSRARNACCASTPRRANSLWTHAYDRTYKISYPGGPRCTPTVDGERVYTLGAEGDLRCLNVADGTLVWSKDLTAEYKFDTPVWGFAGHPLVAGDLLYCLVGGEGSVAVAFDKATGREVWRALTASEPGYCPPTMITHGGQGTALDLARGLDQRPGSSIRQPAVVDPTRPRIRNGDRCPP